MGAQIPPAPGRQLLVFVEDARADADRYAIACVRGMDWPGGLEPKVQDSSESDELARWYGVRRFPAVAIVDDGMIVAIEHECTSDACERLLQVAHARASELRGFVL